MIAAMKILKRDIRRAARSGGSWAYGLVFMAIFLSLSAIALDGKMSVLQQLGVALTGQRGKGGFLAIFISAPLLVPILIFGVAASKAYIDLGWAAVEFRALLGLSLLALALSIPASAAALKTMGTTRMGHMVAMGWPHDIRPCFTDDLYRLYGRLEYRLRPQTSISISRDPSHGWRTEPTHNQVFRELVEHAASTGDDFRAGRTGLTS